MLSVVTWLWQPPRTYRSKFAAEHVNILFRMVRRHYQNPRCIVVTDIPKGIDKDIEIVPAWNDYANVPSPYGAHQPSCYRRLRAFHPDIAKTFGPRFVSLDLDTVVVGDLAPLWDRPEDFIAWGETNANSFYNGSMMEMNAGARSHVWERFNPKTTPAAAKAAGNFGSDQGALSFLLGKGEPIWTTTDGVYSYNVHLRNKTTTVPASARIVMFHGGTDPWSPAAKELAWVREAYQ